MSDAGDVLGRAAFSTVSACSVMLLLKGRSCKLGTSFCTDWTAVRC
jgi:hypothetical protein